MHILVPSAQLAASTDDANLKRTRIQMRERLLRGESVVVSNGGNLTLPTAASDNPTPDRPSIVVPPGKLAASYYWYENDPELLELERQAMTRAESPFRNFALQKESDGRLAWVGQVMPGLLAGGRRTYTLHAVYDHNHPSNDTFGGSVKVYMIDPDLDELSKQLPIPHLLRDGVGSVYLCTARREDFRTGHVTSSAASALGWGVKWIALFELYLNEEITYEQFSEHV